MERTVVLWQDRTDRLAVGLLSPPMDASDARSITLTLEVEAVATMAMFVSIFTMLDPQDPNTWVNVGIANATGVGQFTAVAGGLSSGTNIALGPIVQFRATLSGLGAIVWSASAVFRG